MGCNDQLCMYVYPFFSKSIYLFINNYLVLFKTSLGYNTLMSAFFPILETSPKRAFWYCQQLLFRFFFYLLNHSKTFSFHPCLQFWEEENVRGVDQVQWIRRLRHDYGFVFGQKLVSWCVIIVQNPWLAFFHNSLRFWRIALRNRRLSSR